MIGNLFEFVLVTGVEDESIAVLGKFVGAGCANTGRCSRDKGSFNIGFGVIN